MFDADYLETLKDRRKDSHIYREFQQIGLDIAGMLGDMRHKALYIKLAQQYDKSLLMGIARDVADRKEVNNRGAYFMKVLHERFPNGMKRSGLVPIKKSATKKAANKNTKTDGIRKNKPHTDDTAKK